MRTANVLSTGVTNHLGRRMAEHRSGAGSAIQRGGYVYILADRYGNVLYTGVTNHLGRRMAEHRSGAGSGFTARYHVHKLVYYEVFDDIRSAIRREKQIKGGSRRDKVMLIEGMNPTWRDLSEDFPEE